MTLQDLGNIGDFVGGIAVVISLVYLAFQIRRSDLLLIATPMYSYGMPAALKAWVERLFDSLAGS